jgi:outer membrane biogenesis lipoprotein LolB
VPHVTSPCPTAPPGIRRRALRRTLPLVGLIALAACAPRTLRLPEGPARPLADLDPVLSASLPHCAALRSLTAEVGLSGRVGRERLRGRLLVGLDAPASVRIEAVAPFGAPFFLLAGRGGEATLLFPRDDHVLPAAPVSEILEALAGLDVAAPNLRDWLAGCPGSAPQPEGARAYGDDWAAADLAAGGTAWFRRLDRGWRLLAVTTPRLRVEFDAHAGVQPLQVRFRHPAPDVAPPLDVRLALAQIELNVDLPDRAFVLDVPPDAIPITLDELRQSGPLRDVD